MSFPISLFATESIVAAAGVLLLVFFLIKLPPRLSRAVSNG
jgi:hypothetical protein